jgi:cation transport ATPase
VHAGLDPAAKAEWIRGLGRKTLWVGDGADPAQRGAIAASSVSVSVAALARAREDAADVLVSRGGLAALPELLAIARQHARRVEGDYRVVYGVNLLGAASAFVSTATSLHTGLLSHAGAGLVYARHALALERLAANAVAAERHERSAARLAAANPAAANPAAPSPAAPSPVASGGRGAANGVARG